MGTNKYFATIFFSGCVVFGVGAAEINDMSSASVENLISSKDHLDGQYVGVDGWIEIDPETFRLWSDRDSMKNGGDRGNCVGVVVPKDIPRSKYEGKRVIVHGKFVSDVSGEYVVLGGCRNRSFIFVDRIELYSQALDGR